MADISHSFVMWHTSSCCCAIVLDFLEDIYCIKLEIAPSLFFRLMEQFCLLSSCRCTFCSCQHFLKMNGLSEPQVLLMSFYNCLVALWL